MNQHILAMAMRYASLTARTPMIVIAGSAAGADDGYKSISDLSEVEHENVTAM